MKRLIPIMIPILLSTVLLVFTTCEEDGNDDPASTPPVIEIGKAYQGGIIAYILQPGDPGYDANVPHGLIAATTDQSSGIVWIIGGSTQTTSVPNGTLTCIGSGLVNTNNIIAQAIAAGTSDLLTYAAGRCAAYTNPDTGTGVYSDWYLPSRDELNKLYAVRGAIGGFIPFYYLSSSEANASTAHGQDMFSGFQGGCTKSSNTCLVRAVRSF